MSETKRLGPWGWFVRAFAAGFGATFGVMVASVIGCVVYALVAAGMLTFKSLGEIELNTANAPAPLNAEPPAASAPRYATTVQPAPYVAGPYARTGSRYGGSDPHAAESPQASPATTGYPSTGEAENETPALYAQPAPSVIAIPSQPATSPEDGSSTAPQQP